MKLTKFSFLKKINVFQIPYFVGNKPKTRSMSENVSGKGAAQRSSMSWAKICRSWAVIERKRFRSAHELSWAIAKITAKKISAQLNELSWNLMSWATIAAHERVNTLFFFAAICTTVTVNCCWITLFSRCLIQAQRPWLDATKQSTFLLF